MAYLPPRLDVRCPACGGRATFEEPFEFLPARTLDPARAEGLHRWGGWCVRETYPSVMRWNAPRGSHQFLSTGPDRARGGYRLRERGVVRCRACHRVAAHLLRWPSDAYFQWRVRGTRLWAADAEHARVLLGYIGAVRREPGRYGSYQQSLRELPATILAGRNRSLVAKKIRQALRNAGEPFEEGR